MINYANFADFDQTLTTSPFDMLVMSPTAGSAGVDGGWDLIATLFTVAPRAALTGTTRIVITNASGSAIASYSMSVTFDASYDYYFFGYPLSPASMPSAGGQLHVTGTFSVSSVHIQGTMLYASTSPSTSYPASWTWGSESSQGFDVGSTSNSGTILPDSGYQVFDSFAAALVIADSSAASVAPSFVGVTPWTDILTHVYSTSLKKYSAAFGEANAQASPVLTQPWAVTHVAPSVGSPTYSMSSGAVTFGVAELPLPVAAAIPSRLATIVG